MAGTIVADTIRADSTSTLVLRNGVANTPPTIQDTNGTQIGTFCRAWANFDGTTNTGGFCTIRASFNVTTVADNGTGNYTVNFTTAMPDANYFVGGVPSGDGAAASFLYEANTGANRSNASTTACVIQVTTNAGTAIDRASVNVAIFR
jgi:hypothetical protein